MPAILTSPEEVQRWLDPDIVGEEAVDLLKPIKQKEVESDSFARH